MKIWYLPLEKIETRYTLEWYNQFKEVFEKEGYDYEYIDGEKVVSDLKSKFFLDPVATNIWKLSQMKKLIKRIDEVKDDDIIFFPDLWFPSIEMLPYIKHLTDRKFKIVGILHAGTYDVNDLTYKSGMEYFGKELEQSWFSFIDKIFVATQFHKDMILCRREINPKKIIVTGLPVDVDKLKKYESKEKVNRIAFTGRKADEKGYDLVMKLKRKGYPIKVALDYKFSKEEYYKFLGNSKIVFAPSKQETFGYGVVEGMCMNCVPVVPDRLSFQEYVPDNFRYKKNSEIEEYLDFALKKKFFPFFRMMVEDYDYKNVIKKMIEEAQKC